MSAAGPRDVLRFDPHVHTDASYDARGSVAEVLRWADRNGLDAVAITDHNETAGAQRALELEDDHSVLVVPGVEISTTHGHLLALGVVAEPPVGEPLAWTVGWVRDRGGLAIVPHPFQRSRSGVSKDRLGDCDGIEAFNAWTVTGIQNRRAAAFAARNGLPELGASDAHTPRMVGTAHTELAPGTDPTVAGVLDAVASGRCRAVGESTMVAAYLRKYAGSLRRFVSPAAESSSA